MKVRKKRKRGRGKEEEEGGVKAGVQGGGPRRGVNAGVQGGGQGGGSRRRGGVYDPRAGRTHVGGSTIVASPSDGAL